MKANADKCHLLVTGYYAASVKINEFETESSKKRKPTRCIILSLEVMKKVLDFQEPYYNPRSETSHFRRENEKNKIMWRLVSQIPRTQNMSHSIYCKFLQESKRLIKVWKPEVSPCRMCKNMSQILVSFD